MKFLFFLLLLAAVTQNYCTNPIISSINNKIVRSRTHESLSSSYQSHMENSYPLKYKREKPEYTFADTASVSSSVSSSSSSSSSSDNVITTDASTITVATYSLAASPNTPAYQYEALHDLYTATNGSGWIWKNNTIVFGIPWDFSGKSDPCSDKWQGLLCSCKQKQLCNISSIELINYGLNGTLPESIGNFSYITTLTISSLDLRGRIPSTIGKLILLTQLIIYSSPLESSIPTELGLLKQLQTLDLDSNYLKGTIPTYLGLLQQLKFIDLNNNSLTGPIPTQLGMLPQLQYLYLYNNSLTSTIPTELGMLQQLQNLDIDRNYLKGIIPTELGILVKLKLIDLQTNSFTGAIPTELGMLQQLKDLILSENSFSSTIPTELGMLLQLQGLNVDTNSLIGTIPSELGLLQSLVLIDLNTNPLTGTIPTQLGMLQKLQNLYIFINSLTGTIPTELGLLINLVNFGLDFNSLKGTIPTELGELLKLRYLSFHAISLTGTIPTELGKLIQLRRLLLFSNSLTGTIPSELWMLQELQFLYLDTNSLTGTFPRDLAVLAQLKHLTLFMNSFTSTIPTELGMLLKLEFLDVSTNSLTGTIPTELGMSRQLVQVYFDTNSLTGTIPTEIWNLLRLQALGFSSNSLTGSIPSFNFTRLLVRIYLYENKLSGILSSSICNLKFLDTLYIDGNLLTGSLPPELGTLTNLQQLGLSKNKFQGTIPQSIGNLKNLTIAYFYSNSFSGPIINFTSPFLSKLDLSDNLFTGALLSDIFKLTSLSVFSASKNCLSNDLSAFCGATSSLTELYLNGLGGNNRCKNNRQILKDILNIPKCFWSISSLKKLYLAGNRLAGDIGDVNFTNLVEFSLASNKIGGKFPTSIDGKSLSLLDISNNRVDGTFNLKVNPIDDQSVIKLEVNRLSGPFDVLSLEQFSTISNLNGNLISCNTLPQNDKDIKSYNCGSKNLQNSVIIWCIVFFLFLLFFNLIKLKRKDISILNNYLNHFSDQIVNEDQTKSNAPSMVHLLYSLARLIKVVFTISLTVCLLFICIYSSLKFGSSADSYKTHSEQYMESISGLYLKSPFSAICIFVFYLLFLSILYTTYWKISIQDFSINSIGKNFNLENTTKNGVNSESFLVRLIYYLVRIIIIFSYISSSLFINALYVSYSNYLNENELILFQIFLFVFNITCQHFFLPYITSYLYMEKSLFISSKSIYIYSFLSVFTSLISPLLATLFTDDLCFRQLLFPKEDINFKYSTSSCLLETNGGECVKLMTNYVQIKFSPPFVYSNQVL